MEREKKWPFENYETYEKKWGEDEKFHAKNTTKPLNILPSDKNI